MSEEQKDTQETPQEEQPQAVAGVGLLIVAFTQEDAAEKALKAMKKAKKQGQFYYEAAAVIKKEEDGDIHYHETGDMSTGKGAGIGALIGGVIGILGGPLGIALGAGAGAGVGALAAHGDAGFRDSSLQQIGVALRPGSSAVMVITSKKFLHEFRKAVSDAELYPLMQAVGASIADAQLQGKEMLLGFVMTEEGFAVKRLAFDDVTAEVFGLVATEEGVAAGQAYADETGIIYQVGASTAEGDVVETGVITAEGAAIVQESTPAGSDETTVEAVVALPVAEVEEAAEEAAPEAEEEAAPAEEEAAEEESDENNA